MATRDAIRESLRGGGAWLGAARNWLLWNKDANGRLTWGSEDEVRMTVREIEELACDVATAALYESQRTKREPQ